MHVYSFLYCFTTQLHEEIFSVQKHLKSGTEKREESYFDGGVDDTTDGWEEVTSGNKTTKVIATEEDFDTSFITELFGCVVRTTVRRQGAKVS